MPQRKHFYVAELGSRASFSDVPEDGTSQALECRRTESDRLRHGRAEITASPLWRPTFDVEAAVDARPVATILAIDAVEVTQIASLLTILFHFFGRRQCTMKTLGEFDRVFPADWPLRGA